MLSSLPSAHVYLPVHLILMLSKSFQKLFVQCRINGGRLLECREQKMRLLSSTLPTYTYLGKTF